MTTRPAEAIPVQNFENVLGAFGDWRRYRSAFDEAIGLPAMSEPLPGVTVYGAAGRLESSGKRQAVISGQDLKFIQVLAKFLRPPHDQQLGGVL